MSELKKCPFCGSDDVKLLFGFLAKIPMVVCHNCKATVSFGGKENIEATTASWNSRKGNYGA